MRRALILLSFAVTACFDPTKSGDGNDGGSDTGNTSASESGTGASASATASASGSASASTTAMTGDDTTATTSVDTTGTGTDATTDDTATTTGGVVVPAICDHAPTTLGACADAIDGAPTYGTLACDAAVTDFSIFYEDIYTVDLAVGQCLYVRADNIGEAGMQGGDWADVALQVRSPSGALAWQDDDLACTDTTWTGGACPQALFTADVDGTYEISIVQASGSGCTNGAPYSVYLAIDGVPAGPSLSVDDMLSDCTP
ncbi:MAG: hypothetical protein IPK74_09090 [Deltaproteobacteria bacterium]|nr:hypothetical protein [Deltaproteobacteria bacterium]